MFQFKTSCFFNFFLNAFLSCRGSDRPPPPSGMSSLECNFFLRSPLHLSNIRTTRLKVSITSLDEGIPVILITDPRHIYAISREIQVRLNQVFNVLKYIIIILKVKVCSRFVFLNNLAIETLTHT